jgi:hypothetical protein
MKKILLFAVLLISAGAFGQSKGYLRYDTLVLQKVGGNSELVIMNGSRNTAGILTNVGGGRTQFVASRVSGDTLFVGRDTLTGIGGGGLFGLTDTAFNTYRNVRVGSTAKVNGEANAIIIRNRSGDSTAYNVSGSASVSNPYEPSMFQIDKQLRESWNDTLSLQYGGALLINRRHKFDSTSTRFAAGNRSIVMPIQGVYARGQFYPPRDSTVWRSGRDGQSGGVIRGDFDLGDTYGYNLDISTDVPGMVPTVFESSFDFSREVDNTRRKTLDGGAGGYKSWWKLYQSTITGATQEIGNRVSSFSDFISLGSLYPTIGSGTTKSKILLVSAVDTAIGFKSVPKYRSGNEVRTGVGFWQQGADDYNWIEGKLSVAAATNPTTVAPQTAYLNVKDNLKVYSDYSETNGGLVMYADPSQLYGEFRNTISLYIKDSTAQGQWGSNMTTGRDTREMFVKVFDNYNYTQYPKSGTGGRFSIQTGLNGEFRTTFWRQDGNVTIGTAAETHRLDYRLAVAGKTLLMDSAKVTYSIPSTDSTKTIATTEWVKQRINGITGGGGGSPQGIQSVLTTDNVLTSSSGIDADGNDFTIDNVDDFFVTNPGNLKRLNITALESRLANAATTLAFQVSDSLRIIGTSRTTDTTGFKPIGINPITGAMRYLPWTAEDGNFRTTGNFGHYSQNSPRTAGVDMSYDGSTIARLRAIGGVRLDISAASSYVLLRDRAEIGGGVDYGNNIGLKIWRPNGTSTANLQVWANNSGTPITAVNPAGWVGINNSTPTSFLQVGGSMALNYSNTSSTSITLGNNDYTTFSDATSGNVTVNLPDATTCLGRVYVVKKVDASANTITLDGNGSQTIDGALTKVLTTQYEYTKVQSNGTNWYIVP